MSSNSSSSHRKYKRRRKSSSKKEDTLDTGLWLKRIGLFLLSAFVVAILAYLGMGLAGVLFPVNTNYQANSKGIDIFVTSNGFHTDIVVPIRESATQTDWLKKLNDSTLTAKYSQYSYLSLSWGDEDFYMASYNQAFPPILTCIDAFFLPSNSLMHIEFYPYPLKENEKDVVKLTLSTEQYQHLVKYIDNSFLIEDTGAYVPKNAKGYGKNDYFYYAMGDYHLFQTCNDWTNDALKWIGIPTASKAPFAWGVMYHLR
jgi:uncharacterized protein (TIGR02117 family)